MGSVYSTGKPTIDGGLAGNQFIMLSSLRRRTNHYEGTTQISRRTFREIALIASTSKVILLSRYIKIVRTVARKAVCKGMRRRRVLSSMPDTK